MADSSEYIGWRKLREFADVDLTKSFILSWHVEVETLMIDVDLYLEPGHPFYEKPRPKEKVCIRSAIIEFPFCVAIKPDRGSTEGKLEAIVVNLEIGAIEGLRRFSDGPYEIRGDFGTVKIDAERPILRLRRP